MVSEPGIWSITRRQPAGCVAHRDRLLKLLERLGVLLLEKLEALRRARPSVWALGLTRTRAGPLTTRLQWGEDGSGMAQCV